MKLDINNYPLRLQHLQESEGVSSKNKELILRFYDDCSVQGLTKPLLIRLIDTMVLLGRAIPKDFDVAEIDDLKRLVRTIDELDLTAWTKSTHKAMALITQNLKLQNPYSSLNSC